MWFRHAYKFADSIAIYTVTSTGAKTYDTYLSLVCSKCGKAKKHWLGRGNWGNDTIDNVVQKVYGGWL